MNDIDLSAVRTLKPASSYTCNSLHDAVKLRLGEQGLAARPPQTIPEFFHECCTKYAQRPALAYESVGETPTWTTVTYAEFAAEVQQAALLLMHVGLQERTTLGILSCNCPEWFYVEMGAFRAGGVVAGIYPTNSSEAVYHVLDTSQASVCVVDDAAQMAKVRAVRSRLPSLQAVIQLHGPYGEFMGVEEGYYRWDELVRKQYDKDMLEELERRERKVAANECAMLIYTSGTVGMPKGVMLSHDGIVFDGKAISASLTHIQPGHERSVSYLPLNHIAAQIFDVFVLLDNGGCTYFADRNALKGTLIKTILKAKPTILFGVPRIFEKMYESFAMIEAKMSPLAKFVLEKSRQIVKQYHIDVAAGKSTNKLKYWLASKVTQKIKAAMGFEYCQIVIVGGAPLTVEPKEFFLSINMPLTDAFGMSEASGAIAINVQMNNLNSVGKTIEGFEAKILNPDSEGNGEVCLRGRTIFMGYLNDPEKTKEVLEEDGWMHTGDMGYLDEKDNLVVSGRIKELIITSGGENIPPLRIEELLKKELPAISYAMLVGDRRKYLIMLLTFKTDFDFNTGMPLDTLHSDVISWLQSLGLDYKCLSQLLGIPSDLQKASAASLQVKAPPKILNAIEAAIKRVNEMAISNAQRIQKFTILPHDFSLHTGELGPTLKVRRNIVSQKYADVIESMYK